MALSIDWATKIISVPKADLTLISGTLYELDVDAFRLELKDIEDSEEGVVFVDTHRHNTEVTVAGVTYARSVEIINGYTVTFEAGSYTISCTGANHNISDVLNYSGVSLIVNNAAGLITTIQGSGVTAQDKTDIIDGVWDEVISGHRTAGTTGAALALSGFENGAVHLDVLHGSAGTAYPLGTANNPVNNFADAIAISVANGTKKIKVSSNFDAPAILLPGSDISGYYIYGGEATVAVVYLVTGSVASYTMFQRLIISGDAGGSAIVVSEGGIANITNFAGVLVESQLLGTVSMKTPSCQLDLVQCKGSVNTLYGESVIDFNGATTTNMSWQDIDGVIHIRDLAGTGSTIPIHLSGGVLHFHSDVTGGSFTVIGHGEVIDESVGATIDTSGLITSTAALDAALADHRIDGSVGDAIARTGFTDGAVHLDPLHGSAGTAYPMGTATKPVDSFTDAIAICTANGLKKIKVNSNFDTPATLLPGQDISGYYIYGGEASVPLVYLVTGSVTSYTLFEKVLVSGDVGGSAIVITDGGVTNVTNCDAVLTRCFILGTISMDAPSCQLDMIQTSGSVNRLWGTSEIDFNGATTTNMSWQDVAGEIVISNLAGTGSTIPITMAGGKLTFESTVTGGSFVISGHGDVVDNSVGATIDTTGLRPLRTQFDNTELARAILQNKTITDPGTGVMTVYDEDGVTPLYTANIYEDAAGTQQYQGDGIERREALS